MQPSQVQDPFLTIGELAAHTGLSPATLRMWESRHGFPTPHRLPSGHRRYAVESIEAVKAVLARQRAGVRLESAIAQTRTPSEPSSLSVYADLRRTNPNLAPLVLGKATLIAVSRAIEDEFGAGAERGILFGAFQHDRHLEASLARWTDLARTARSTHVFTSPSPDHSYDDSNLIHVPLADDSLMSREWSVVCDAVSQPVALSAWELPGQGAVPDRLRQFETVWTLNPAAVRQAALTCAEVAADSGVMSARQLLGELDPPTVSSGDADGASRLLLRVVKYAEQRLTR